MLLSMQQSAPVQPSLNSSSFAGLLASLASPPRQSENVALPWNDADLGEDVVTLSYERALRAHARYKPADGCDLPAAQRAPQGVSDITSAPNSPDALSDEEVPLQQTVAPQSAHDRNLRSASVTIRLSEAECARLRQLAAEAGLTISAYLRSCTFEVEALRAQVKETLAELRSAETQEKPAATPRVRRSWFGWLMRLIPRRSSPAPSNPA